MISSFIPNFLKVTYWRLTWNLTNPLKSNWFGFSLEKELSGEGHHTFLKKTLNTGTYGICRNCINFVKRLSKTSIWAYLLIQHTLYIKITICGCIIPTCAPYIAKCDEMFSTCNQRGRRAGLHPAPNQFKIPIVTQKVLHGTDCVF